MNQLEKDLYNDLRQNQWEKIELKIKHIKNKGIDPKTLCIPEEARIYAKFKKYLKYNKDKTNQAWLKDFQKENEELIVKTRNISEIVNKLQSNSIQDAISLLTANLMIQPTNDELNELLLITYFISKDFENFVNHNILQNRLIHKYEETERLFNAKSYESAVQLAREHLEEYPKDVDFLNLLARALVQQNQLEEAKKILLKSHNEKETLECVNELYKIYKLQNETDSLLLFSEKLEKLLTESPFCNFYHIYEKICLILERAEIALNRSNKIETIGLINKAEHLINTSLTKEVDNFEPDYLLYLETKGEETPQYFMQDLLTKLNYLKKQIHETSM